MSKQVRVPDCVRPEVVTNAQTKQARAAIEICLIVLGLVAHLALLPRHIFSDGGIRFRDLTYLLADGTISPGKYSFIGPLFASPLWILGNLLFHAPRDGVVFYNSAVFSASVGAIYWLLRNRIDRTLLRTFLLLLIAASMFPNHETNFYGEIFTAICVGVGTLAVAFGPAIAGWFAVVLGVANTPASLVGLGCLTLMRVLERKRLRYLLPLAAAACLIVAENAIRRGNPFTSYYEGEPGFTYPFFFGLISILFSFGKGLIFFTPGLFLPARELLLKLRQGGQQLASVHRLWLAFTLGLVLIYSSWWAWYGGWWWGPRFFLFASLPASLTLAVRLHAARRSALSLRAHLLTLGVFLLSIWVNINGAVFDQNTLAEVCTAHNYQHEYLCHYIPQYSVLWRPFTTAEPLDWHGAAYITYAVIVCIYLASPLIHTILRLCAHGLTAYLHTPQTPDVGTGATFTVGE